MSEKISEYITSVTALASGDLMDVSKLISTSPLEYQSQKLNYSVLLTELNTDLSITLQSAYNASTQPQILTSVAKGGLVIRSGQALDTNSVLELKNISGSSTFVVGGNGIVANGDWQATAIAAAFGGTGQTSYTIGDLMYASNTTAIAKLGIGTSGQVLTVSGGGIPTWATASSSNLGSANLTSTDDARTFTLKSGGTASQNLQFLNSGGGNLLKLSGNNIIDFGVSGTGILERHYCKANSSIQTYYANGVQMIDIDGSSGAHQYFSTSGSRVMYFTPYVNYATMRLYGSQTRFEIYSGGTAYYQVYADSNSVTNYLVNNSNIIKGTINTNGLASFGAASSGSYQLEVYGSTLHKGSGSTSATTTALFENSSSVSTLKVKDDGYCILKANNAAIASGDLANNEMSFYIDEGSNHCVVKVKYSSGTVKTGTFNLT